MLIPELTDATGNIAQFVLVMVWAVLGRDNSGDQVSWHSVYPGHYSSLSYTISSALTLNLLTLSQPGVKWIHSNNIQNMDQWELWIVKYMSMSTVNDCDAERMTMTSNVKMVGSFLSWFLRICATDVKKLRWIMCVYPVKQSNIVFLIIILVSHCCGGSWQCWSVALWLMSWYSKKLWLRLWSSTISMTRHQPNPLCPTQATTTTIQNLFHTQTCVINNII